MNQNKLIFTMISFILLTLFLLKTNFIWNFSKKSESIFPIETNYLAYPFPSISSNHFKTSKELSPSSQSYLEKYLDEKGYQMSLGYYNLTTKETFYYHADKLYYGASLIKTLDAIYLYDKNLVTSSLKPYIQKAISRSDNPSHQYLVNYIGKQNLKNYAASLGTANALTTHDNYGNTTVYDQIIYLQKLYSLIESHESLKSYFINDYANYLKLDGTTNLHKYGYYNSYFHEVGIFLEKEPYLLVILTEHGKDNYKSIMKELSFLIYQYHMGILSNT